MQTRFFTDKRGSLRINPIFEKNVKNYCILPLPLL